MTLTLQIKREIRDVLARQAMASGVEVAPYATALLEQAVQTADNVRNATPAKDMVELFAPLRGLNLVFECDRDKPSSGRNTPIPDPHP